MLLQVKYLYQFISYLVEVIACSALWVGVHVVGLSKLGLSSLEGVFYREEI